MAPDLSFETSAKGVVCGIDEVGRGPLAGPVIAAAVILPDPVPAVLRDGLDDSKRISASRRERMCAILRECARIGIGGAEVEEIDRLNILQATLLAMRRAYDALGIRVDHALVDGNQSPLLACPVTCIVKGDAKSLSIAAASVVAKVTRDALMTGLSLEHPGYGWERNAGYGTAEHLSALRRLGVTRHHRRSFAPVMAALAEEPGKDTIMS